MKSLFGDDALQLRPVLGFFALLVPLPEVVVYFCACGPLYTQTGTPFYASPEVWMDKPYDSKSDVWSLGCVLYELTTCEPPFQTDNMQDLYRKVLKGSFPPIPSHYS